MNANSPTAMFDALDESDTDPLLAAAAEVAGRAVGNPSYGVVVVVLRPGTDDYRVVSGGDSGVLRAAVSVAVAAGNDRVWRDAPHVDTAEARIRVLPEVVASAAEAVGKHRVHTGCVRRHDGTIDVAVIWFEGWSGVADTAERRRALVDLEHAALIAAERAELVAATAQPTVDDDDGRRTWDPDDPDLDAVSGLMTEDAFVERFDDFGGDEAAVLLIDLDGFDGATDETVRLVADRIALDLADADLLARVDHGRFAAAIGDRGRGDVMMLAKQVMAAIAAPLPDGTAPASLTATVSLAHQDGLADLEELFDAATSAMASGKRSGTKLVLAA